MEKVKEITECCICTEIFADPRMLPCIHTFCLKCLQQMALKMKGSPGEMMPCPVCRQEFKIPTGGFENLQKNFFMSRLADITKTPEPSENVSHCEICIEGSKDEATPVASKFCVQCHRHLCDRCCQYHRLIPELRQHQLTPIEESKFKKELLHRFAVQFCDRHREEKAKMFCFDCSEIMCWMCFAESHQQHKCSDIEKAAETFCEQILEVISTANTVLKESDQIKENLDKSRMKLLKMVENTESEINQMRNELKDLIDKSADALLSELNAIKHKWLKSIETIREENDGNVISCNSFKSYCEKLRLDGSAANICHSKQYITSQDLKFKRIHNSNNSNNNDNSVSIMVRSVIPLQNISVEKSRLKDFKERILGQIKEELITTTGQQQGNNETNSSASIHWINQLDLSQASFHDIRGVTKLDDEIYVLCFHPNSILIFREDQDKFSFRNKIKIKDIQDPRDIVSSEKSRCLYISDKDNICIWKITIENLQVMKLLSNVNSQTLSVTTDDLLLISRNYLSFYRLETYEQNGKLRQSVRLPTNIHSPIHSIQKPNGEFIVVHSQEKDGRRERWVISRLFEDGQTVLSQFHPREKSETLSYPRYLSLDSENNRLFVADYWHNQRVILLDSNTLQFKQILLSNEENGIFRPFRIYCDARRKNVIVVHDGKVDIYKVK